MTLEQLCKKFYGAGTGSTTVYVFDDECCFDSFCERSKGDDEVLFTIRSDFEPSVYLKDEYCKTKVKEISAVNTNALAVWILPPEIGGSNGN